MWYQQCTASTIVVGLREKEREREKSLKSLKSLKFTLTKKILAVFQIPAIRETQLYQSLIENTQPH